MSGKEQYEYETIHVTPGTIIWDNDLKEMGEKGYRLVGTIPLTQFNYDDGRVVTITNGTNLIFERRKETE